MTRRQNEEHESLPVDIAHGYDNFPQQDIRRRYVRDLIYQESYVILPT